MACGRAGDTGPAGDPMHSVGSQSGCHSHLPVSLILKEENQKSSGKQLICKGKATKRKPNSSMGWEGLDAIAWSSWAMWAAGPPRMTSMGSLSLQASQEVPVLRHEIQLVGETSMPSRRKGQGHTWQGPPLVPRLRLSLVALALRVGPLPPFLGCVQVNIDPLCFKWIV